MTDSDIDDLDAALDGLTPAEEPESEPPPRPIEVPNGKPSRYAGRTLFDELFAEESRPIEHTATGGPEEKVAYFREKLRRLEEKVARFREAWATRESEMDALESLLEQEQSHAADYRSRMQALEQFVARKKTEMEAYGKRVAQAFAEKDGIERKLREEMDRIRAAADRERSELHQALESFDQDLAQRNESIRTLKATIELQRDTVEARTRELKQARVQAEEGRADLLDGLRALNKEVAARDATIEQLKAHEATDGREVTGEIADALAAKDARLKRYRRALEKAKAEIHRLQFEVGSAKRELTDTKKKRRSTGLGSGWDGVDALTEVSEMAALAARITSELERKAQTVLQGTKVRRGDIKEMGQLASRLIDAIDRIRRAVGRG